MKLYLLGIIFLCNISFFYGQQKIDSIPKKPNPIIFAEVVLGYAGGEASGFTAGTTLNYQRKNDLFSFRYINQTGYDFVFVPIGFGGIPLLNNDLNLDEISLLYGKRFIKEGHSWSFSGGISANSAFFKERIEGAVIRRSETFIGFPFEINIKWFKKEKKRFRAYYGIIPIGKPTSFGRSLGFKLYGNIGEFSYVGLGLNYGFGWHKRY